MDYQYLFPFEKISRGSKILIYGAGVIGLDYLKQILMTNYCTVVGMVDKSWNLISHLVVPVFSPEDVLDIEYDFMVLALKSGNVAKDVREYYRQMSVDDSKIIYTGLRKTVSGIANDVLFNNKSTNLKIDKEFAFNIEKQAIAIKMATGIGDLIQQKSLFMELSRLFCGCKIDIYVTTNKEITKSFYIDEDALNQVIEDFGLVLYNRNCNKYLLAISVMYMIQIDYVDFDLARQLGYNQYLLLEHLQNDIKQWGLCLSTHDQYRIHCERVIYNGWNCISGYNYCSIFNIQSQYVQLKLDKNYEKSFEELGLPQLYITFNYGNGSTRTYIKENNDARQWPRKYFSDFIKMFRVCYPKIAVVQLGDKNVEKLNEADKYMLGHHIEVLKYILKNSILHISSEGGLMHLATQLGTKCVVLFGPTQLKFFGYDKNINIKSEKCGDCYLLYEASFECARHLERPECMWSITPEMVMEKVKAYLKERGYEATLENVS